MKKKVSIKPIYEKDKCIGYRYFLDGLQIAQSLWNGVSVIGAVHEEYRHIPFFENFRPMPAPDFVAYISIMEGSL